jgi:Ca-activated chloride channel family protein
VQAKVEMNEDVLKEVAKITGGLYFRARDQKSLAEIYKTIDSLEKTKIEVKEYLNTQEIYSHFLWPAIILTFIFLLLQNSIFLKIP